LIRHRIIEGFRGTGAEPSLDEVAGRLGLDRSRLISLLHRESPLNDLAGLTLEEARRVLRQFPGMTVFASDLEKTIVDFDDARGQIHEIERAAKGGG
jgi:hypothetical protein